MDIRKTWHKLFELGVLVKGFNGGWETLSGIFILLTGQLTLNNWFLALTRNELLEDPHDKVMNLVAHLLQSFSPDIQKFAAFYLLIHGLLNIFLAIQLYREKHWAYIVTIVTVALSMLYQIHRITLHHSLVLTVITVFDAVFIVLAWHEYQYHLGKNLSRKREI